MTGRGGHPSGCRGQRDPTNQGASVITSPVPSSAYAEFAARHIGIDSESRAKMLAELGYATSLDD
jgi:hypothetical protein